MRRKDAAIGEYEERPPPLALRAEAKAPAAPGEFNGSGGAASKVSHAPREARMNGRFGPSRLFWLSGILLLIATTLGAIWAVNSSGNGADSQADNDKNSDPPAVVALGFVYSNPDVVSLSPVRSGRVEFVAPEGNTLIKKGAVLLRLDDRIASLEVDAAKAALDDAVEQQKKAADLPRKHKIDLEMQNNAIQVARSKLKIQENEFKIKQRLFAKEVINREELEISAEQGRVLSALVDSEDAKLRALKLVKPELQVARAKHDVDAKQVLLKKAELAREECKLLAPRDGRVLRVNVSVGEIVSPQAKQPALQFCPDEDRIVRAEVPQEWSDLVAPGQTVTIEDDTRAKRAWRGKIKEVADWFSQRRHPIIEPMVFNDVRTLEIVIEVDRDAPKLRIGQRVRVNIAHRGN